MELERVARKFNFESKTSTQSARRVSRHADPRLFLDLSGQPHIRPTNDVRELILQSCHGTLIRLGDLSRYRESELVTKDRNWGPAIGYYDLASVINPASGASQNQLAIIALADGNHLRATYHLYRALSAQEPHPTAKGNLEIELRKIMSAWAKRELIRPEDAGIPGRALTPWFLYLHAKCYKGTDFPEHDELESEVLSQLAVEIRERSLEGTLQKFCLVNIAAEDFAKVRSIGKNSKQYHCSSHAFAYLFLSDESVLEARVFFQRINVKTFFTLLQILLVELERTASFEDPNSKDAMPIPDKVSVVARRILPALRHYSSWLLTNSQSLVEQKEEKDSALSIQIKEFWKIYAGTLSLLASSFDVVSLPEIDYLLEEDEESLGFAPLDQDATSRRYVGGGHRPKPRMNDIGIERSHPNMEMLYRIREFVIDGLDLVVRGVRERHLRYYKQASRLLTSYRKFRWLLWIVKIRRPLSIRKRVCLRSSIPAPMASMHFRLRASSARISHRPFNIHTLLQRPKACSAVPSLLRPLCPPTCMRSLRALSDLLTRTRMKPRPMTNLLS